MNANTKFVRNILISIFVLYLAIYYWNPVSGILGSFFVGMTPVFAGVGIAYVLNIFMNFFEKHYFPKYYDMPIVVKTRKPLCLVATYISFFAILFFVVRMIIPELVECIEKLIADIPSVMDSLVDSALENEFIRDNLPADFRELLVNLDTKAWEEIVGTYALPVIESVGVAAGAIVDVLMALVSSVISVFISIVLSAYFLVSRATIKNQICRILHCYAPKYERKTLYVASVFNNSFRRFFVGQIIEAVILGVLCVVGMLIFGFPYPQMIGVFIGFTALIPVAGAYIGAIVGAIIIATTSPIQALFFILFIIVLQQIEGNFIYPKVVGNSIGLPGVWVLVAITVGGSLFGIVGMLLGVPLFAAVYRLVKENVMKHECEEEASRSHPKPTEEEKK